MAWWRAATGGFASAMAPMVVLAATASLALPAPVAAAPATPAPPTAFGLALWTEAQREQTLAAIGRAPVIESLYADFVQPFPAIAVNRAHRRGADALISWEPWDWQVGPSVDQPDFSLRSIISGKHDAYIRDWLRAAGDAADGGAVVIRFAPEMNGDWNPWSAGVNGNTAAQYVTAWKHVRRLARQVGAKGLQWMWNPSVSYEGSTPMSSLYPGPGQVDLIGLDGFNWGTLRPWSHWQSYDEVFASSIRELRTLAPGKPWGIAETASTAAGGDKGAWIADAFRRARQQGATFFIWFEMDKETDWRIASTPNGSSAVLAALADQAAWRTLPKEQPAEGPAE